MKLVIVAAVGLVLAGPAMAACECMCVNGRMKPICESSLDLAPMCGLEMCPMTPLSMAPMAPLTLPPLGTKSCRQVQILNRGTGFYEWRQVCQ